MPFAAFQGKEGSGKCSVLLIYQVDNLLLCVVVFGLNT